MIARSDGDWNSSNEEKSKTHFQSGLAKQRRHFIDQMVFPKSLKSRNSGTETSNSQAHLQLQDLASFL